MGGWEGGLPRGWGTLRMGRGFTKGVGLYGWRGVYPEGGDFRDGRGLPRGGDFPQGVGYQRSYMQ